MAEPFAVTPGPDGSDLLPMGEAGQTAGIPVPLAPIPDAGILPDTTPVVGPPPQLRLPPPPPPPPSPTQDPRQQLAALIALGMAVGQGVKGGGVGALQGFNETQQALRQDQLAQYQRAVNEQKLQEGVIKTQFQQDEIDYRQREAKLQQALANFKTQAMKLTDKSQYDALADAYGNSLRAAGYRTIDPNWLRQNIPYVKPSQTALAQKAFTAWTSNPNNKRLLDENPAQAATSVVEVDLNGDGVKERMPLAKLAEAAGQSFAHDTNGGIIAVPKDANTGTSPFDVALKNQVDKFVAENRRQPNPTEKQTLIDKALQQTRPPKDAPTVVVQTVDDSGNPVTKIVPKVAGAEYKGKPNAVTENRLTSAKAVNQTGTDIINEIEKNKAILGPILSRYASAADFFGAPPPQFSHLAGQIESFALANMGVHGMRSNGGAQDIKQTIGLGRHTPESLIATIQGLMGFSTHLLNNSGQGDSSDQGWVDLGNGMRVRRKGQ